METKSIYQRLALIQDKLAVAKARENDYGSFSYRNSEDILKAAKPLAKENNCAIIMSEDLVVVNEATYVKSTATLVAYDIDSNNMVSAIAYAREPIQKKGMDDSQITGSSTSYARKYALGGLFAVDDGKDADSMDNRDHSTKSDFNNKANYAKQRARQAVIEGAKKYSAAKKSYKTQIDFAKVRQKLATIDNLDELENYWRELKPSDNQAKFLQRDFAKRKEEINGME